MSEPVTVVEVGPRDGLQNEPRQIPAEEKIRLVDLLSDAGLPRIEVASFVRPDRVPQMADGADVLAGIRRRKGTIYSALTPNLQGYERARTAGADEVAVFAAASESFSTRNLNATIAESLERFRPVAEAAAADGRRLRGYVSCVIACPYEGPVAPAAVARVVERLFALGCAEVSLGDTTGVGTPKPVALMLADAVRVAGAARLAGHFHDTNGRALESVAAALDAGLRVFDASAAGLGGCPFAPGAAGNLGTGKLVDHLAAEGAETEIDREKLAEAEAFAASLRGARAS